MSEHKRIVEKYMEGFRRTDHAMILSCLADDVVWEMPGFFRLQGKDAFDREIENEAFVGSPIIQVSRMVEEKNVVIAEGSVQARRREGGTLRAVFCDVFEIKGARIARVVSYLVELK
jgi:ketosteroid isomerase-like protein